MPPAKEGAVSVIRSPDSTPWPRRTPWPHRHGSATDAQRTLRDALELLRDGLCAVCRQRDDSAHRWLAYFVNESHTDEGVRLRVRSAVGFCPAHTRHLLADTSAPWLLPQVCDDALCGGVRLLGGRPARQTPCPACANAHDAEERALDDLLRALGRTPVRDAVEGGAVCLPHLAELAARANTVDGTRLTAAARERLTGQDPDVAWLTGLDPDAERRARLLERLDPLLESEAPQLRDSITARWTADAALACCPLCLAEHRAARRLSSWLAATTGTAAPAHEETGLCARHLRDLTASDGPNTPAVLADYRDRWTIRLTRFGEWSQGNRASRRDAVAFLLAAPRCRACDEERTAGRRQLELLTAELRDAVAARAYEQAHGVCLHHVLTWPGSPPPLVRTVLDARLALLRWELDEALRKQDWHTRHEAKGAEMAVGSRAPTLLDGRVHGGLPAARDRAPATEDGPPGTG
jgi:hypothetical protein